MEGSHSDVKNYAKMSEMVEQKKKMIQQEDIHIVDIMLSSAASAKAHRNNIELELFYSLIFFYY